MPSALRALHHHRFALLWAGQPLSRIGDFVYGIVVAWWVLKAPGSAAIMGKVLIVTFLPDAEFTLVGGVARVADARLGRGTGSDLHGGGRQEP